MSDHSLIQRAETHVRQLLAGDATGHDWPHIERVRQLALTIGREEGADLHVVELAAILHDVADWKFAGGDGSAGPLAIRAWLQGENTDADLIEHVCQIVAQISFKGAGVATPMSSHEGQVVQDADRLDALGAVGIARAFAYGGAKGQPIHDSDRPVEMHGSFAAYQKGSGSTINHFYEKLLLLKDRMNTPAGRRLAAARHEFMQRFLDSFFAESAGER